MPRPGRTGAKFDPITAGLDVHPLAGRPQRHRTANDDVGQDHRGPHHASCAAGWIFATRLKGAASSSTATRIITTQAMGPRPSGIFAICGGKRFSIATNRSPAARLPQERRKEPKTQRRCSTDLKIAQRKRAADCRPSSFLLVRRLRQRCWAITQRVARLGHVVIIPEPQRLEFFLLRPHLVERVALK